MLRLPVFAVALLAASATHASTFVVDVGGNNPPAFTPQTITIIAGDSIAFINKGGLHNAVADDGSFRCARGCDGDGHSGNGTASTSNWVASVKFSSPGTIGYYCEEHGAPGQGMYGTIIVQPLVPVRLQSFDVD
jgi:plastocyanin